MPNTRANTRLTLPSMMAARVPLENAEMAAAVERPMPGSSASSSGIAGEHAVVFRHHALGALVQVARARVVAQAAPLRHHVFDRRFAPASRRVGKRVRKRA